ncbi:MAG: 3-phosphoshikimate 1-carboxyvinyltransferase [Acidobacteria bacterium]|nr:3-phosphoshikimate 1-carboxyvinyltransferase [Acidobacteriota bacterium]
MSHVSSVAVVPARRVHARLRVPGDKSISHRYALLAAVAEGASRLANYSPGADCQSTLSCLAQLGVAIARGEDGTVTILGRGRAGLRSAAAPLDCGNSGTTMRLLSGILAGLPFPSRLAGDASLSRRPMRRVIEPLELMGARVESTGGRPPLTVHGAQLHGIEYRLPIPSAQVKSAILLAGLAAEGTTTVIEPAQTRDHTEQALVAFGVEMTPGGLKVVLEGGQRLTARALAVPGDFSSAAFWMVAAALLPGSRIEIEDVGLNPTRTALVGVLRRYGARVTATRADSTAGEPRGSIIVEGDRAGSVDIGPEEVPGLIDELPALAALGAAGGTVRVRGAGELRVKESDRIAVLVAGFRDLGIEAEEHEDGFTIGGSARPPAGGVAHAHDDHRMAMAFAIAALSARGPSTIEGAEAVAVSYPDFFAVLGRLAAPDRTGAAR